MKRILSLALIFLLFGNLDIRGGNFYKIYYLKNDELESLYYKNCHFIGDFTEEEKMYYLIRQSFNKDTIKGIFLEKGNLYINFNEKIMEETKASFEENNKIKTLLYTAFQFENIKTITFLKEGKIFTMSGGTNIFKQDRYDLNIN